LLLKGACGQPRSEASTRPHFHVGALDDADGHRAAAGGDARAGPFVDPALHACGIGDVSLKGNAGVHVLQPGGSSVRMKASAVRARSRYSSNVE